MTFQKDTMKIPEYNVLVVDDEEEIRKLLVKILSKTGRQCLEAVDGVDALDKAILKEFDAIVTDIVMPRMDGITLTKELVKLYPDLPIMIITGHNEEYSAASAIAAGVREFIKKPFSLPEFIIRFDKMMRNHEAQCEIKEKYDNMLFSAQRDSSEEIERLKGEIKLLGGN